MQEMAHSNAGAPMKSMHWDWEVSGEAIQTTALVIGSTYHKESILRQWK